MNNLEKNLQSLRAEFHLSGKAARGLKNLKDNYLAPNKQEELKHLLRFHRPIPVRGPELVRRFEVDALLDFYCLLLTAIFSGYVPGRLTEDLREEIISVLGNPAVEKYYNIHYPYLLAANMLQYAIEEREFVQEPNLETIGAFTEFVSLNRFLKNDKEIERFMGMLDYVRYDGNTIAQVNLILSSYDDLNRVFTIKDNSEAARSVRGFVKYTSFISQFRTLLADTEQYPILQSAIWTFHRYYFDQIDSKMAKFLSGAFDNVARAMTSPSVFAAIAGELPTDVSKTKLDEDQLNTFATLVIDRARADFDFVLDEKWGDNLKKYFSSEGNGFVPTQTDQKSYKWDVFISHSGNDRDIVEQLTTHLKLNHISYWLDSEQVSPGMSLVNSLQLGLKESHFALLVVDSHLNEGHYELFEALASNTQNETIAIFTQDSKVLSTTKIMKNIPYLFSGLWRLGASDFLESSKGFEGLIELIKSQRTTDF